MLRFLLHVCLFVNVDQLVFFCGRVCFLWAGVLLLLGGCVVVVVGGGAMIFWCSLLEHLGYGG